MARSGAGIALSAPVAAAVWQKCLRVKYDVRIDFMASEFLLFSSQFTTKSIDFSARPIAPIGPIDMVPVLGDVAFKLPGKSIQYEMPFLIHTS
jgi:hypothetical protein